MPEVKTRERAKDIKLLDKSAVVGQRMKKAFIRSKEQAMRGRSEEDTTPGSYAEDNVQRTADEAGQLGAYGAKLAVQRGRQVFQQRRIKKMTEDRQRQNAPNTPDIPIPPDLPVERGRELARRQAAARREQTRLIRRNQEVGQSEALTSTPIKRPVHTVKQRDVSAARGISASQRPIKTPQRTARAVIKTSQVSEAGRQLALRDSAQTAQVTARTAKAAAKTSAAKVKSAAKATAAAVKSLAAAVKTSFALILSGSWVVVLMVVIVVLFGGILALFGDTSESNAYTPVSAEVDAYTPLIHLYAEKHGIPDYVDLIKAIMMTESGGKGSDPMQAAESGYNTRYPRKPNGIKDPEYSIDVGVQTIAAVLKQAKVESPLDLERIKLALQGYNCVKRSWLKRSGKQRRLFRTTTLRNQMSG